MVPSSQKPFSTPVFDPRKNPRLCTLHLNGSRFYEVVSVSLLNNAFSVVSCAGVGPAALAL